MINEYEDGAHLETAALGLEGNGYQGGPVPS